MKQELAAVLAEVGEFEEVPVDADFYTDLGADSMVMARFCARLRKRPDLPSFSIKDIYEHATVAALVSSLEDKIDADLETSSDEPRSIEAEPHVVDAGVLEPATPVGRIQYGLCALLQILVGIGGLLLSSFIIARTYDWISGATDFSTIYLRSAIVSSAVFVGLSILPILAKWLLIGRWKPRQIRVWSIGYFRFWLVRRLVQFNPLVLFVGSPIYNLYLRALGAKIGRGAVIFSRSVPVCTDLLTIGAGAVIRKDSIFTGYRAAAGWIQTGSVNIGDGAFVGELTVLDVNTSIGNDAQIGHASSLQAGQSILDGERRVGAPAYQSTETDHLLARSSGGGTIRRAMYSLGQLLILFSFTLPVALSVVLVVIRSGITPNALLATGRSPFSGWLFYRDALISSAVIFFGLILFRLLFVSTVPRLLNRAIKPGRVYPLYSLRYGIHRLIARWTNVVALTTLFGDSSYIVYYLRLVGYKVSFKEQTGSNFGTAVKHDNPYSVTVGQGTMVADGLSIINADYSSNSFQVSPVTIGAHSFLGNNIGYPADGKTGENCLHGTKLMVPVEGPIRENTGFLGSPGFEIPRTVLRDEQFDNVKEGAVHEKRLKTKNRHNRRTIALFLVSRWILTFASVSFVLGAAELYERFGIPIILAASASASIFPLFYIILMERASILFRSLPPVHCSIYAPEALRIERYWKMSWRARALNGTPFKSFFWRLTGVRLGKRVFDDGCAMIERSMIVVGDHCTLNAGSVIQPHSQEDGSYKSDYITIGAGCTVGAATLVHYGVTMGDGSSVGPNSFVMKGSEVEPGSFWTENPAREIATAVDQHEDNAQHKEIAQHEDIDRHDDIEQHEDIEQDDAQQRDTSAAQIDGQLAETTEADQLPLPANAAEGEPMNTQTKAAQDYWQGVLLAGGSTRMPRWASGPNLTSYETEFAEDLLLASRRVASDLDVSVETVFLAAHSKVSAALSGEKEVATGFVPNAGAPALPCRVAVEAGSWRDLIAAVDAVESDLLAHVDFRVDDLRQELHLSEAAFETEFNSTGTPGDLLTDTVLSVEFLHSEGTPSLRLQYRTDRLNEQAVARIAGYHLEALRLMTEDPHAEHQNQSLLSARELDFQLNGLAGPAKELPDKRFHELFEDYVKLAPNDVCAVFGDQQLTYGELNARANRLGRALLARGVRRETVVAVVTERNLDWMTAVLAIFKAGGVYLPIEPHFPADRINRTLSRAGCRLVMTEPGSTATLYEALESLPAAKGFFIETAFREDHAETDIGIEVRLDQLAYIYFTSGSTGEPKGAMCEHDGMLNHLYAKIDDLEIAEGEVIAQIAPQCFDISLWQLLAALLVGGQTLIVEQDTLLEPERFINTITGGQVSVMQVVPSYLEVLLSFLDHHPQDLPELHCVSVTGEALTPELVQRWFAAKPQIKLANAYGLTETSDDTNHEVLDRPPADGIIPLGSVVNNVRVYVVDEHLTPVPLGAPGEIVFSGVCVGRGYINDPERTMQAYLDDPHRPGDRLYRSGDFGRWRPDHKLEFLGRRDAQVKIRGFRIEIGEIENTLLEIPDIRHAAVIVAERGDNKVLVAFYSGEEQEPETLARQLGQSLPEYMVPSIYHWQESLPLTDNGKTNKKVLKQQALAKDANTAEVAEPATKAESRIVAGWSSVLGMKAAQIGRHDDFFDLGGTSLSAVELVIALGGEVSLKDVTRHPTVAGLAHRLEKGEGTTRSGMLQLLSNPDEGDAGALVCVPYAGGNAVNYRAMAKALSGSGLAVYAVELPGHDMAAESEPFLPLDEVVEQLVDEVIGLNLTKVSLWGHSSGTPLALEAARSLHARGIELPRVYLAAQLPGDPEDRMAHSKYLDGRTNSEIAAKLGTDGGYGELAELDTERSDLIGAAYRHDCIEAHRYFIAALGTANADKLSVPVTVVVAADDEATNEATDGYRQWEMLAENVDVHVLAHGGHYFLRSRPDHAAEIVRRPREAQATRRSRASSKKDANGFVIKRRKNAEPKGTQAKSTQPKSSQPKGSQTRRSQRKRAAAKKTMVTVAPENSKLELRETAGQPPLVTVNATDGSAWAAEHKEQLRTAVAEHGAVQIRGLGLRDAEAVAAIATGMQSGLMTEREAFAPRSTLPGGVYSSSAWPPNQQMCMHHELSYSLEVPSLMLFGCLAAPETGGAIPVADSVAMMDSLPTDLVTRFEQEGWLLTRSYTEEIGLSVEEAFGTPDREAVEAYCRENAIETDWQPNGGLRTKQRRRATIQHPVTGKSCWFNSIAFLNQFTMSDEVRELLVDMYGPDGLPFNTSFGNGDPIDEDTVSLINQSYDANTLRSPLETGDLLLVDNIRTAHSREPFAGTREVVVAMADPIRLDQMTPSMTTG